MPLFEGHQSQKTFLQKTIIDIEYKFVIYEYFFAGWTKIYNAHIYWIPQRKNIDKVHIKLHIQVTKSLLLKTY